MLLFLHKLSGFPSRTEQWNDLFDFLLTREREEAGAGEGGRGRVLEVDEIRGEGGKEKDRSQLMLNCYH